jgi:cytochrome c553
MRVVELGLCLSAAVAAVAFAATGQAADTGAVGVGGQGLQAKIEYCQDCHGASARGYRGFYPIPRLAGQKPEYIENQLRAFIEGRREKHLPLRMARVHGVSPALRAALAAHFQDLNPSPIGNAPRQLAAAGKKIYEEGTPDTNVPACAACHGPEAKGEEAIPRLAGQLYPYMVKALSEWDSQRGQNPTKPDTSSTMLPIVHNMTKSQIAAVAAYVSYLK